MWIVIVEIINILDKKGFFDIRIKNINLKIGIWINFDKERDLKMIEYVRV